MVKMDLDILSKITELSCLGWLDPSNGHITVSFFNNLKDDKPDMVAYLNQDMSWDLREVLGEINTNNPATAFIWVVTNINFLASLLVVSSTVILFSFARIISDTPEIGLSRALGMKRKNLFVLLLLEPLFLLIISGVPGAIIGTLLLS